MLFSSNINQFGSNSEASKLSLCKVVSEFTGEYTEAETWLMKYLLTSKSPIKINKLIFKNKKIKNKKT